MTKLPMRLTAVLAAAWLSGCHRYVPAPLPSIQQGEEVRVYLSRAAILGLPEEVPVNNLYVAGRLMGREGDSLSVGIPIGSREPGYVSDDIRQVIRVRSAEVMDVQRRELSVPRTALLVAGAAVGLGLVMTLIFDAEESVDPGDENPDLSRVPIFRLPFSFPLFDP